MRTAILSWIIIKFMAISIITNDNCFFSTRVFIFICISRASFIRSLPTRRLWCWNSIVSFLLQEQSFRTNMFPKDTSHMHVQKKCVWKTYPAPALPLSGNVNFLSCQISLPGGKGPLGVIINLKYNQFSLTIFHSHNNHLQVNSFSINTYPNFFIIFLISF